MKYKQQQIALPFLSTLQTKLKQQANTGASGLENLRCVYCLKSEWPNIVQICSAFDFIDFNKEILDNINIFFLCQPINEN